MTKQLSYFKLRGRGEPIRLALHAAGVEYTDTADSDGIDFAAMKVSTFNGPHLKTCTRDVSTTMHLSLDH